MKKTMGKKGLFLSLATKVGRKIYPFLPPLFQKLALALYFKLQKVEKPLKIALAVPITEQPYGGENIGMVSVVLPVYNQANFLEESIKSVLSQTYQNFELIIVDDGSTDHIETILKKYYQHPKIKIYRQPNRGLPTALNVGFSQAKGEYWTWTSADNIMLPNQLEEQVRFLKKHKDATMVYCNYKAIDDTGRPLINSDFRRHNQNPPGSDFIDLPRSTENLNIVQDNFIGASFMYRAWAGKILGPYAPEMGVEDYDYWMRMNTLFKIKHIGKRGAFYLYRVHENTLNAKAKEYNILAKVQKLMEYDKERRAFYAKKFSLLIIDKEKTFSRTNFGQFIENFSLANNLERARNSKREGKQIILIVDPLDFNGIASYVEDVKKIPDTFIIYYLKSELTEFDAENKIFQLADFILTEKYHNLGLLLRRRKEVFWLKKPKNSINIIFPLANNWLFLRKTKPPENLAIPSLYFPRKINLLIEITNFDKGGLEQVVYDIAEGLDKEKFNVFIGVVKKAGLLATKIKESGIAVFHLKNKSEYLKILNNHQIDLVNTHFSDKIFYLPKDNKPPVVNFIHNCYVWFNKELTRRFLKVTRQADFHIAVSKNAAYYAEKKLGLDPLKTVVIPNGLNIKRFEKLSRPRITRKSLGLSPEDYIFINPAAFSPPKGHYLILSALKNLVINYPKIKVISLGEIADKSYFNNLRIEIKKANLTKNFILMEFKEEIEDFYRLADAFLLPSLYEGWSIAVMEAMYFGLPLILSDVGGARDIIENNDIGIIIKNPYQDVTELDLSKLIRLSYKKTPQNTEELSKAMINFIQNRERWQRAGKKGRDKIIKWYNLDAIIKEYEKVFIRNVKKT